MVDAESIARWPQPEFTCKQASSYDRETVAPDKPGWFANNDQNQFIRIETNGGRTEKVMLNADGPGCLVRFWLTTDRNEKGTLRIYLDEAPEPALAFPAYDLLSGGLKLGPPLVQPHPGYKDDSNLEGMKRSAPVLFTVPGQLYDGGGNGTWWLQEIDRPFEHWSVLARFNWRQGNLQWKRPNAPETEVKFADLGLDFDREYLVFEFWTQTFLGKCKGSFKAPPQGSNNALQVFAIREAQPYPWIISTTRHISQGGVDLLDERWDAGSKTLSGKSAVVSGDAYVLTVHLPDGFRLVALKSAAKRSKRRTGTEPPRCASCRPSPRRSSGR